ncbi:hypothetical protein KR222_002997, partial [Zaprionus bogoriensis]
MWHAPGELHDASLRFMRRLMQCLLLLPPSCRMNLKLLYSVVVFVHLAFVFKWRFSFNYHVVYDIRNDHVSRIIDLLNFVALVLAHAIVAMELLWRNSSEQVQQQLQRIRYTLRVQFGHSVNLQRIRNCCNALYGSLIARVLFLFAMTMYSNAYTDTSVLLLYSFYSELVLLVRFSEFSVHSALVMCFYRDLRDASSNLMLELERKRFDSFLVRRELLARLYTMQQLHGQLWCTVRLIERNFELSLATVMLKLFVDTSVLPYWIFICVTSEKMLPVILCGLTSEIVWKFHSLNTLTDCLTEELCKFIEIIVPSLICSHCERLYRQLRSIFHSLSSDRRNQQLNEALLSISAQLGQEHFVFSAGGLLKLNNVTLGKFIFGMVSYIVVCIQFRLSMPA